MTIYFGKELFIRFTASAFRKLPSIYVFSYFPFGFEGRLWDLIVSVPDHCLSFYFYSVVWIKYFSSVQSSVVRTNTKSLRLYSVDDCHSESSEKEGNNSVTISRRLVSKESESSNASNRQTVHPSTDHVLWIYNQSREMGTNFFINICFHMDGVSHSGKHCQNSSRQSSKCSRASELVPETINRFRQFACLFCDD